MFAMVINPLIGIYNDLYLPTEKGFPYIPIMGWMTPHIPCFDRNAHCQAKAWGSAQGVAPTGGHETAQMG